MNYLLTQARRNRQVPWLVTSVLALWCFAAGVLYVRYTPAGDDDAPVFLEALDRIEIIAEATVEAREYASVGGSPPADSHPLGDGKTAFIIGSLDVTEETDIVSCGTRFVGA